MATFPRCLWSNVSEVIRTYPWNGPDSCWSGTGKNRSTCNAPKLQTTLSTQVPKKRNDPIFSIHRLITGRLVALYCYAIINAYRSQSACSAGCIYRATKMKHVTWSTIWRTGCIEFPIDGFGRSYEARLSEWDDGSQASKETWHDFIGEISG